MWLRRSNVTTGAEWINTRFGLLKGAKMSHTIVVVFAIIMGLGYLAYGFIGVGKFIEIFILELFTFDLLFFLKSICCNPQSYSSLIDNP